MSVFEMEIQMLPEMSMALQEGSDSHAQGGYRDPDRQQSSEDSDDEGSISSFISIDIEMLTMIGEPPSEEDPTDQWPNDDPVQAFSDPEFEFPPCGAYGLEPMPGFPAPSPIEFTKADPRDPWVRPSTAMSEATQAKFLHHMGCAPAGSGPYGGSLDHGVFQVGAHENANQDGYNIHPVSPLRYLEPEAPVRTHSPVRRKARMKITPTRSELAALLHWQRQSLDMTYSQVQDTALDLSKRGSGIFAPIHTSGGLDLSEGMTDSGGSPKRRRSDGDAS